MSDEIFDFMDQAATEMAAEYERIRRRSREDPGTAGDEGEENWAELLRAWLPRSYEVATRGRVVAHDGRASRQFDVLVLKPGYPPGLINKKMYMAEGVAAAFECKITLRSVHILEAIERAAELKSLFDPRSGTPRAELHSPIFVGLLAHSVEAGSSKDRQVWTGFLTRRDSEAIQHPRHMLDLACVADLGTWIAFKATYLPRYFGDVWEASRQLYGWPPGGCVQTAFMEPMEATVGRTPSPIGVMLFHLLDALGWEDQQIRPVAEHFGKAGLSGSSQGSGRVWLPEDVYTPEVLNQIAAGGLRNGGLWDGWTMVC